jgi:hypothetical protein
MKYSPNTFRKDIINCITVAENEINLRKSGIDGESTSEQLENVILPELKHLLNLIENGNLPPKNERYLISFGNAFKVWGWNMQKTTKLYLQLHNLNSNYKLL